MPKVLFVEDEHHPGIILDMSEDLYRELQVYALSRGALIVEIKQ